MEWLGLLGVGGGALALIAVATFAALNPVRAIALAKDIGAFIIDKARALVKWARGSDRNWWKIGFVSLGVVFALLAWYADDRRREVIIVQERCASEKQELDRQHQPVREAAFTNFWELKACTEELARVIGEDQDTDTLNAEAVARAEAKARQAAREAAEWRRRYEDRPASCSAALTALEDACDSLSDY